MPFNLKEQLVFYGAYHRDPTNVAIHMACVPLLLATGFVFGTNTPSLPLPTTRAPRLSALLHRTHLPPNLCTLAATTYSTLYLLLSPNAAGYSLAPLILLTASLLNRLRAYTQSAKSTGSRLTMKTVNSVAVLVHVVSWIAQFIGHGKYEGRKPALVDNLVQALFLAPLFVWYEALFKLGLYKDLKKGVDEGVKAEIAKLEAKKAVKKE